jgi:hypothetical protein
MFFEVGGQAMITPIRTGMTVGVFGKGRLRGQVVPTILPGFAIRRPAENLDEINSQRGILSKALVACSDIVVVSAQKKSDLQDVLEMSRKETIFIAVVRSTSNIVVRSLSAQNQRKWFAVRFQESEPSEKASRRGRGQELKALLPIKPKDLQKQLAFWLPQLGAEILARSEPREEAAA